MDIDAKDRNGKTPLHLACIDNAYEAVPRLIKAGANPNIRLPDDRTILEYVIEKDDLHLAKLLLDNGASPNARTKSGDSLLHHAIADEDGERALLLLEHGADCKSQSDKHGSPLQHAISTNNLTSVCLVLDYLAEGVSDPKISKEDWKFAIFMFARQLADINLLAEMIFAYFDGKRDASKIAALCNELMPLATKNNAHAVVAELISLGADDPKIQQQMKQRASIETAIKNHDLKLLKTALKNGIPSDFKLSNGIAAFEWAVQQNEMKVAQLLLNAGVKPEGNSTDGLLASAVDRGDLAAVKLLLRYRARAAPNMQGLTGGQAPSLLHLAVLEIAAGSLDMGVLTLFALDSADFREGVGSERNLVQTARDLDSPELARELIRLGASGRKDNAGQQAMDRSAVLKPSKARTSLKT